MAATSAANGRANDNTGRTHCRSDSPQESQTAISLSRQKRVRTVSVEM